MQKLKLAHENRQPELHPYDFNNKNDGNKPGKENFRKWNVIFSATVSIFCKQVCNNLRYQSVLGGLLRQTFVIVVFLFFW